MTECKGGGGSEDRRRPRTSAAQLQRLDLFADLDDRALQQLRRLSSLQVYERGEEVRRSTEGVDVTYVVVEGSVDLLHMGPGGHVLKSVQLEPGEVFEFGTPYAAEGDLVIVKVRSRTATIYAVPRSVFLRTVIANPHAADIYIEQERSRRQRAETSARELAFDSVFTRVKHWLRRLALESGEGMARCSLEHLARLAGTREEEVSRAIAELERQGLVVRRGHGRIEVPDPDALV